ncbi:LmbE family N-acetylglucosaminyl deacetylase [Kribbella voronezhensis]|uniref:LmbE family N-acetylglucosaminyl deacetylase n=1 Tax=Kribbella voronezhensis TaxID=2512212 RepID=A0A4R7TA03_9ACTN|nr:PIG-L deacetylase family protein [Kribbella voronezhensis]TDU88735.1 LmbE family N-acetylglucosaminyl deacetylase [Kribbella voronezhensis]
MSLPAGDPRPDEEIERVLVVVAHPDDLDFGSAGTIAGWTGAGIEVSYCLLTDGQAGGFEPDRDRAEMPAVRRSEQTTAAGHVGVRDLHFLGYVDGELAPTHELVRDIVRVIRKVRPQRLVTSSPERNWARLPASHPDHLAAGEATTRAFFPAAGNPFAFPELIAEGLEAWTVGELWLVAHPENNHYVDITEHFDAKVKAILSHVSQHPDPDNLPDRVRAWNAQNAGAAGLPEGHLAEAFAVVRLG